jgi:F-type H+-transporting ATPase subunit delta
MQNPRLASRYAKSLLDLAVERNILEPVLKDMQLIDNICTKSADFVVMLRSPVINGDKKMAILKDILKNSDVNELTYAFMNLLMVKGRELNLGEIAQAFITQYNTLKNIRIVKLTTAAPINDAVKQSIVAKLAASMPKDTIDLKIAIDADLIGGFVLEIEDKLYDASVKKNLDDLRANVIDSSYVAKMA